MKEIKILIAAIFVATISSCSNDAETEQTVSTAKTSKTAKSALVNPTVYAAGYGQSSWATQTAATIWTDGIAYDLTDGVYRGQGMAVFKEGTNVYVLTREQNTLVSGSALICKVWKNNTLLYTLPSSSNTQLNSMSVSGGIVYVAGTEYNGSKFVAKLWTNTTVTNLTTGTNNGEAKSVYVSGGIIYVVIHEQQSNGKYEVKLWKKNGATITTTSVSNTSYDSRASSVFVSGTDVYVGGQVASTINNFGYRATVWKNGVATYLTDGAYTANVNSVFVSGTNVYAAGFKFNGTNSIALSWKNSVETQLSIGNNTAYSTSVYVYGTDVYVGGCEQNPNYSNVANMGRVWKNGTLLYTTSDAYTHSITSITVQ